MSNYMRDLKTGDSDDMYELFPDDMLIFCFGKVVDGLSGIHTHFSIMIHSDITLFCKNSVESII